MHAHRVVDVPQYTRKAQVREENDAHEEQDMTPAHYIIPYDFLSVRVAEALGMSGKLNTEVRGEARVRVP